MEDKKLIDVVKTFLSAQGYSTDEQEPLFLESLNYLYLVLHIESELNIGISDNLFFSQSFPEVETITTLCERLRLACN